MRVEAGRLSAARQVPGGRVLGRRAVLAWPAVLPASTQAAPGGFPGDVEIPWAPIVVAVLVTLGLAAALFHRWSGDRAGARRGALERRHPGQPWLWRPDWASGRIVYSGRVGFGLWLLALGWNAAAWPLAFVVLREAVGKGEWEALLVLLFPLVGLLLLGAAVYFTWRHLRYGDSTLELATLPGVIGGALQGRLYTGLRLKPGERVTLRLTNYQRQTTGSGKERTTHYRKLWQQEQVLGTEELSRRRGGAVVIPVNYAVPAGLQPATVLGTEDGILWRLEVTAPMPGVDYYAAFDVPVFATAVGRIPEPLRERRSEALEASVDPAQALDLRIRRTATGGTEYYWAPARRKGASVVVTAVTLAVAAGYGYSLATGNSLGFSPLWGGVFVLLLAGLSLQMWTASTRLVIEPGRVRVRNGFAGLGRWREFAPEEIGGVEPVTAAASELPYFHLRLRLGDGRQIRLGWMNSPARHDAHAEGQWLAQEIRSRLREAAR